ncbi:MAG: hypothetical protein AAF916_01575 [Planctomycetota bacterium]
MPKKHAENRRVLHTHCVWCSFLCCLLGFPVAASAQSEEQLEAQIQQALENAQELLEQVPTLQQIEADEAAMRDLLNRTQDDLQAERARAAALEAQLQGLTGSSGGTATLNPTAQPIPNTTDETARWLRFPERRVNALGMLETSAHRVGQVPEGTEAFVPRWPTHLQLPDGVAWPSVEIDGPYTRLVQTDALGQRRPLGTFGLRQIDTGGTEVAWSWPGGRQVAADQDAWLEPLLRRTRFEAQRAGIALAEFQIEPRAVGLPEPMPARGGVTLSLLRDLGVDPAIAAVSITIESDGTMRRLEADAAQAGWVGPTASLWVRLTADGQSLQVRRGPGLDDHLAAIDRQRHAWRRDLRAADADASIQTQAQAELDRLDEQEASLEQLRTSFDSDLIPPSASVHTTQKPVPAVRLIDPQTGVVLVRLTLAPEPASLR